MRCDGRPGGPGTALISKEVIAPICDHAQGNLRAQLLELAALFFETCAVPAASETKAATRRLRRASFPSARRLAGRLEQQGWLVDGLWPEGAVGSSAVSPNAANPSWARSGHGRLRRHLLRSSLRRGAFRVASCFIPLRTHWINGICRHRRHQPRPTPRPGDHRPAYASISRPTADVSTRPAAARP